MKHSEKSSLTTLFTNKRIPWFELILTIAILAASLYAALSDAQNFSLRWFTRDDAYYYFKVAQNISEGHGSTFDGINKANGYHPLWMLVCIPIFSLARFDLVLPLRILLLVMSGLSLGTGILLYRLLGKVFTPAVGALAALFWVFDFKTIINIYQQGLESGIAAFFIMLLIYKLYEFEQTCCTQTPTPKQLAILGFIAALTIFSRLDLIFFAMLAGFWIVFRGHNLRYFLPLDIVAIISIVFYSFIRRFTLPEYYDYADVTVIMAGLSLVVKLLCWYFFGLYQQNTLQHMAVRASVATLIGSGIVGVIMLGITALGDFAGFPRSVIGWDLGLTMAYLILSRATAISLQTEPKTTIAPWNELKEKWQTWLKNGFAYFGTAFGLLGVYMVWSKFTFGTFSPVSGQIKRWWGSFPARVYGGATRSPLEFFGIGYEGDGLAWTPLANRLGEWAQQGTRITAQAEQKYFLALVGLIVALFIFLFINKHKSKTAIIQLGFIPLVTSSILQAVYYHSSGYSAYKEWYWITQRLTVVLLACFVVGIILSRVRIPQRNTLAWLLAVWFGISMAQDYWAGIKNVMRYNRWSADTPMMEIATLLEQNTEPGSLIGFTGGGNVGYFIQDRTIVNMDGLINSHEYFLALQAGTAGEYLNSIGLDYVLANPSILDQQPYNGQFNDYLTYVNVDYGGKKLLRYQTPK